LTGGGRINFDGTRNWLAKSDSRLLDSVEFALCLDTIANEEKLFLHASKIPKEGNLVKLFESFNTTAELLNIPLEFVHKKINISNPDIDWEHELFSRKKVSAATLSHLDHPTSPLLVRSNIFDVRSKVNATILKRNIKFIAESIAKYIYGFSGRPLEVFGGSLTPNSDFIDAWLNTVTSVPRSIPFLPQTLPIVAGLQKVLSEYTSEVSNQTYPLESDYVFYDSATASMSAYKVKPNIFDFILLIAIAIYLSGLYAILKGPTEFLQQVKSLFASTDKRLRKKIQ